MVSQTRLWPLFLLHLLDFGDHVSAKPCRFSGSRHYARAENIMVLVYWYSGRHFLYCRRRRGIRIKLIGLPSCRSRTGGMRLRRSALFIGYQISGFLSIILPIAAIYYFRTVFVGRALSLSFFAEWHFIEQIFSTDERDTVILYAVLFNKCRRIRSSIDRKVEPQ